MQGVNTKVKIQKSFSIFIFLFAVCLIFPKLVNGQIPPPYVNCGQTGNPEFHSLRPYQASPCKKGASDTSLLCGNDFMGVDETDEVGISDAQSCSAADAQGYQTCQFNIPVARKVTLTYPDAELPILGNTQLVPNGGSTTPPQILNSAERMNGYVSWYFNGVIGRAEEDYPNTSDEEDIRNVVDFSGPLKKLLSWSSQARDRINTIKAATKDGTRHDQIVGCTSSFLGLGINEGPVACYKNKGEGFLSPVIDWVQGIKEHRLSDWDDPKRLPPLEEDYKDFYEYWLAYEAWRGKYCVTIPILGKKFYFCFDDPLNLARPNYWAALFDHIPFSSTEDRKGRVYVEQGTLTYTTQEPDGNIAPGVTFKPEGGIGKGVPYSNDLYFSHTEETLKLGELLQQTYAPKDYAIVADVSLGSDTDDPDKFYNTYRCDLRNVRWNSGDQLFSKSSTGGGEAIVGDLHFNVIFSCRLRSWTSPGCIAGCGGDPVCEEGCQRETKCKKEYKVAMATYTQTPLIDDIYDSLVLGKMSIFRRIYPAGILDSIELMDLPGVTSANYASAFDQTFAGAYASQRPGTKAEIYIPHLGSIQEYFQKGIQEALLPQGFGPGSEVSGEPDYPKPKPATVPPLCHWGDGNVGYGCDYYDENAKEGCGPGQDPVCESGRCNPYELSMRKDYTSKGCQPPYSQPDCTTKDLCVAIKFKKNAEGGWGPCHYMNENVCVRADINPDPKKPATCAGVCNWACCAYQ